MSTIRKKDTEQSVRDGGSAEVFLTTLASGEAVFEKDHFLQKSGQVPIDDLIDTLHRYKNFLCATNQEPRGEFCVSADKELAERIVLSCQLVIDPTRELVAPTQPEHTKLAQAIRNHSEAHEVAAKVLKKSDTKKPFSMEDFLNILETSPNRKVTEDLLQLAGPDYPTVFTINGALKPLLSRMPETLPASSSLSFRCAVEFVSTPNKFARVKITQKDTASARLLKYFSDNVDVRLGDNIDAHDDLLIAQLNKHELWILVSAVCPTTSKPTAQKKGTLQFLRILHERTNTQDFYAQRRKLLQDRRSANLPYEDEEITC